MSERREESLTLTLPGGGQLRGDLASTDQVGPGAVLFVHGFGGHRRGEKARAVEAACARRGWTFAAFDFRGHGESSGQIVDLRGSSLQEDLDAVWDDLRRRGLKRLALVGSSMGGFASAWFAVRRPEVVVALALIAPAVNFLRWRWEAMSDEERQQWKETGRLRVRSPWFASEVELGYGVVEEMDRYPAERLAEQLRRPTLIFHGLADDTVPWQHSLALAEQTGNPDVELRLYKDGDHRLTAIKEEMAEAACDFFARRGFQHCS